MKYRALHNPDHPRGQDVEFIFEEGRGIVSADEAARRLNAAEKLVDALNYYAAMRFNREKMEWMPGGPDKARAALDMWEKK